MCLILHRRVRSSLFETIRIFVYAKETANLAVSCFQSASVVETAIKNAKYAGNKWNYSGMQSIQTMMKAIMNIKVAAFCIQRIDHETSNKSIEVVTEFIVLCITTSLKELRL